MTSSLKPLLNVYNLSRESYGSSYRNVFEITHTYRPANRSLTTAEAVLPAYINDKSDERQLATPRVLPLPHNQPKSELNSLSHPAGLSHTPHRPSNSQNAFEMPHTKQHSGPLHPSYFSQQQTSIPRSKTNTQEQESPLLNQGPHALRSGLVLDSNYAHAIIPPYAMPANPPQYWENPEQIHSTNLLQQTLPGDDQLGRRKKIDWGLINPNLETNEHVRKCDLRGQQGVYQTGFNIFTRQFQPLIEREFAFPNKRVHQKLLGIIWKKLSEEEQSSYKERAITGILHMTLVRAIGFNSERKALNDPLFKSLTQNILRIISVRMQIEEFFRGHKRYHPIQKLEHENSQDEKMFKKHEKLQKRRAIQIFETKELQNEEEDEKEATGSAAGGGRGKCQRIPQTIELYQVSEGSEKQIKLRTNEYEVPDKLRFMNTLKQQNKREAKQLSKEQKKVRNAQDQLTRFLPLIFQAQEEEEEYERALLSLDPVMMKNREFSRQPSFKEPLPLSVQEIRQRGIFPMKQTDTIKPIEIQRDIQISPGLERLRRELSPISQQGKFTQSAFSPHIKEGSNSEQPNYGSALRSSPYMNKPAFLGNSPYGFFQKGPQDLFQSLSSQEFQTLETFEPKKSTFQARVPYFNRRMFDNENESRSDEL